MAEILLGLDFGTTNIKAVAITLAGEPVAQASRRTPVHSTGPGQGVHEPQELWATVCEVLREVNSSLPAGSKPLGIAIASMGEAGVPLDKNGQTLYPFICWHDVRTRPQWEWWRDNFGAKEIYLRTGLPLHPMWSVMKLLWLKENEPAVFAATCRWLCVEDFAIWRLTGEQATSYSIACRTMAFNLLQRRWDEDILSAAGLSSDLFPQAHPSGKIIGKLSAAAAKETGLEEGLPVATGGHDHLCAALAAGAVEPEIALDSSGTTETMVITLARPNLGEAMTSYGYSQGCHVIADRYALFAGVHGGGITLEWLAGILQTDVEGLLQEAEASPPGAGGVYFLPHLRGAGTPHRDPAAAALFFGLSDSTGRAHLARAALEGVAFEMALNFSVLRESAGINLERLRAVGGGTRSPLWNQLKADITGLPMEVPGVTEATATGAALLAGLALGALNAQSATTLLPVSQQFLPSPERHPDYRRRLESVYQHLYPAVSPLAQVSGVGGQVLRPKPKTRL